MAEDLPGAGRTAFVICPIGDKLEALGTEGRARYEESAQMWENVFKPACDALGLEAVRADKIASPGEITDQIFVLLRDADVVIADLSGANPNVMYELGLRHSRDLPTIQVGEHGRLPFDVNTVRTLQFKRTETGFFDLRDSLIEALQQSLAGNGSRTSATRVWSEAPVSDPHAFLVAAASSAAADEDDEDNEPSVLEMLADGEGSLSVLTDSLTDANVSIVEIGQIVSEATGQIATSDAANKGFAGRVLVARQLSVALKEPVDRFEEEIEQFYSSLQLANAMFRYILRAMTDNPIEARIVGPAFLDKLDELADSAGGAEIGFAHMAQSAAQWKSLSRDLREPGKKIERVCHRMIEGISTVTGWKVPIAEARAALEAAQDSS